MANVLDYDIVANEFESSDIILFTFMFIHVEKLWIPLSPPPQGLNNPCCGG